MKHFIITSAFVLIGLYSNCQILIEFNQGYGTFKFRDLKNYQIGKLKTINSPYIKSVESFPSNSYFNLTVNYLVNNKEQIGLKYGYISTGARNHLADYSGEYRLDLVLNSYKFGGIYKLLIEENKPIKTYLQVTSGLVKTTLKYEEDLSIINSSIINNFSMMESSQIFIEPALTNTFCIKNSFAMNLMLGYEFDFRRNLLLESKETKITADWSGIRLEIGISFNINTSNKNQ